jgi:hypothetical protein
MRFVKWTCVRWAGCCLLALPIGGCGLPLDLLNPNLASSLGFDVSTIQSGQGTVIVAFQNATRYPVTFFAFESQDTTDLSIDSRNFSLEVANGEVGNEVLSCPLGLISPGSLNASFQISEVAAEVQAEAGAVQVAYGGAPLQINSAFSCGDVIEMRVSPSGDATTFVLTVRVVPGR